MFVGDLLKFVSILIGLVNYYILSDFEGKLRDTHNFINCKSKTYCFIISLFT